MMRICFIACLAFFYATGLAAAAEFGSAQAECNYLAKDYGVSPENMAEFMADCVARLKPVYEPDAPAPAPSPEEAPAQIEQPPAAEVVPPDAGQAPVPPGGKVVRGEDSEDEPEVLEGQAMPENQEQPQAGEGSPPEEAPDDTQQ